MQQDFIVMLQNNFSILDMNFSIAMKPHCLIDVFYTSISFGALR
jgi:hypothetical protein